MSWRIKQNDDELQTEIWHEGKFEAGWTQFHIGDELTVGKLENMLNYAFNREIDAGKREIREALGVK